MALTDLINKFTTKTIKGIPKEADESYLSQGGDPSYSNTKYRFIDQNGRYILIILMHEWMDEDKLEEFKKKGFPVGEMLEFKCVRKELKPRIDILEGNNYRFPRYVTGNLAERTYLAFDMKIIPKQ